MFRVVSVFTVLFFFSPLWAFEDKKVSDWNQNYDYIYAIPPLSFYYDHGVLAGSYPLGKDYTEISFNDVSRFLGHVCLCGAGGFRISQIALNVLGKGEKRLERGEFTLISSNDHTVSDVIAYVLGCSKRKKPENNTYFVDETIKNPRREYQYYVAYRPAKTAVHVTYRKHLLIGNEAMDKLWKIELAYESDPESVAQADEKLYQDNMRKMVREVLLGNMAGLIEAERISYDTFMSRLNNIKP